MNQEIIKEIKRIFKEEEYIKEIENYEHNIIYYKSIKKNIDSIINFWNKKNKDEIQQIINIYENIKQDLYEQYFTGMINKENVLVIFNEKFKNKVGYGLINNLFNIMKNTNGFTNVKLTKIGIIKGFIGKEGNIEYSNKLEDYINFFKSIKYEKK